MEPAERRKIEALITLLLRCVDARPTLTARQLIALTEIVRAGSCTRAELSRRIEMSEGAVSRLVQDLGPEGADLVRLNGRQIELSDRIRKGFESYLSE